MIDGDGGVLFSCAATDAAEDGDGVDAFTSPALGVCVDDCACEVARTEAVSPSGITFPI